MKQSPSNNSEVSIIEIQAITTTTKMKLLMLLLINALLLTCLFITLTIGQSSQPPPSSSVSELPPHSSTDLVNDDVTDQPTETTTPVMPCDVRSDCDQCVGGSGNCMWCMSTQKCFNFEGIPKSCNKTDIKYKTCLIPASWWVIAVASVGGIIFLALFCCCCYCCCCKKDNRRQLTKEMRKWERKMNISRENANKRKEERQEKMDEIRRKYGIGEYHKDAENKEPDYSKRYQRFN